MHIYPYYCISPRDKKKILRKTIIVKHNIENIGKNDPKLLFTPGQFGARKD